MGHDTKSTRSVIRNKNFSKNSHYIIDNNVSCPPTYPKIGNVGQTVHQKSYRTARFKGKKH